MIYSLLTHKQAAERLGISKYKFKQLVSNEGIDQVDISAKRTKISEKDIQDFKNRLDLEQSFKLYQGEIIKNLINI